MVLRSSGGATAALGSITQACEQTEYGKYHAGSNHGRCSDGDQQQWIDELGPVSDDTCRRCPSLASLASSSSSSLALVLSSLALVLSSLAWALALSLSRWLFTADYVCFHESFLLDEHLRT